LRRKKICFYVQATAVLSQAVNRDNSNNSLTTPQKDM